MLLSQASGIENSGHAILLSMSSPYIISFLHQPAPVFYNWCWLEYFNKLICEKFSLTRQNISSAFCGILFLTKSLPVFSVINSRALAVILQGSLPQGITLYLKLISAIQINVSVKV